MIRNTDEQDLSDERAGLMHRHASALRPVSWLAIAWLSGLGGVAVSHCGAETSEESCLVTCDDGDPCTNDSCAIDGGCLNEIDAACCFDNGSCDDGDTCTLDGCDVGNRCFNDYIAGCCVTVEHCDDGLDCTEDLCPEETGQCVNRVMVGCCDEDEGCTDGNPCTEDTCVSGICINTLAQTCCTDGVCDSGSPSRYLPEKVLVAVGDGTLLAYNPHDDLPYHYRGSGNVKPLGPEDGSGAATAAQEERLAQLDDNHKHNFVWLTDFDVVRPDPNIAGIMHLFGTVTYARHLDVGAETIVALMPDDELVNVQRPFGRFSYSMPEVVDQIEEAGGLPVLAHPGRTSTTLEEVHMISGALWGIEGIANTDDVAGNLVFVDARLSSGQYVCISAGSSTIADDYSLTWGYQVISSTRPQLEREDLLSQVRNCNFFACRVQSSTYELVQDLSLTIENGKLVVRVEDIIDRVRFVGRDGTVLLLVEGEQEAQYTPVGTELYVRVEVERDSGHSICLSQPVWFFRR